jgi:hypothetical protein
VERPFKRATEHADHGPDFTDFTDYTDYTDGLLSFQPLMNAGRRTLGAAGEASHRASGATGRASRQDKNKSIRVISVIRG